MEKVLELYKYIDGVNDAPFPNEEQQVVTSDFRYDVKRMGGAPTITCTILHVLCLDKLWDESVYAYFNGERFFIKQVPTSSYANTDSRYKHELELVSERVVLDNVYVYDVVDNNELNDKPVANNSKFAFFGTIHEFAKRLNQSLQYSKLEYRIVVDDGISSEAMMISFQDQFFSNAIQESYNAYNIPYYFVGKEIHFGYTDNVITRPFKYGKDESLLSIQKQNANYKIVNRVTGVGSADNIPYYYPNDYESKEEVEAHGGVWVNPQPNLMPPIYRESFGSDRFYEALNNTYQIPNSSEYYEFSNPYIKGKPKEHIVNFENIKPTIKGIENASGYRIDMFSEFSYDANDNDEVDKEGNYLHPYFFAKLRKFDGKHGFNLFDHSIDEQEMVISMTSGSCGACEFVIGVDETTQKNTVQVDSNGYLKRDDKGDVKFGEPQDEQNDTINNEVWIALRKNVDTFGIIMPNATHNYKPSVNDTFVILHIDLPKSYIIAAEDNLKVQLIEYMSLNNSEKFNFSISFSRIFFAEYPDILEQLNENARIQIEYDNTIYDLYVSSYSYTMNNNSSLPEIKVELSDTLTISQNALQTAIDEVKSEIISSQSSINVDWIKQGTKHFLSKTKEDQAQKLIKFLGGLEVGESILDFANGKGTVITPNGLVQTDRMEVRGSAIFKEFIFNRIQAQEGDTSYSENGLVEECVLMDDGTYMLHLQKRWENDFTGFKEGDILYGDVNNLFSTGEYYTSWVRVLHVDTAANIITVIPYSDSQVPGGVNHAPETQMRLVRRGNAIDKTRQSYWYLSATDEKCFVWLEGVDKPIIEEYNYYVMIGRPKRLELFANLPIDYEQSYIFARGAIIEDLHRVNFEGKPIKQLNDRGFWSLETAQSDHPYTSSNEIADTVWHYGCRWQCLVTGTTQEPKFSASEWAMVEGNPTFVIDVNSTNNYVFDMDVISKLNSAGQYDVFTTLIVTGTLYNQDVTEHILDADCSWTRDTGNVTEDNAWAIKRASAGKELALTVEDLGANYNMMRSCTFKVTALLRDGQQFEMDTYEITF